MRKRKFTKDFHGCLKLGLNSYTNLLFHAFFGKDANESFIVIGLNSYTNLLFHASFGKDSNESFIVTPAWIHSFACPGGLACVNWKAFGICQLCHRIRSRRTNSRTLYYPNCSATFQLLLRAGILP